MDLQVKDKLVLVPDLRHRLRQLRWFSTAFRDNAATIQAHFGFTFQIDEKRLNTMFFDWLAAVSSQDESARADRADYIVFVAGLALRGFIRSKPAMLVSDNGAEMNADVATVDIIRFWPEGFLYTNFCICAVAAVHEQELGTPPDLNKATSDLRTWWSFRENAAEDPNTAIGFFDRFLGANPNWQFPTVARERSAIRKALSFQPMASRRIS